MISIDSQPKAPPEWIRVYLTGHDPQLSLSMAGLLRAQPNFSVVGIAGSFENMLADLRTKEVDVLILDIWIGQGECLEAIQDLKQIRPRMKILVTTGGGAEDQQVASILAGAHGFLYRPFDLVKAVTLMQDGKVFFDGAALAEALNPPPPVQTPSSPALSEEDIEFLDSLRQGMSNAEIAKKLNTEIKAVYQRRFRLKNKLGLDTARALFHFARSAGDVVGSRALRCKRILLVDDEPMVRQSVKMILKSSGHTIETAVDAREALKKLEAESFDLIVADLRLPGMQGDELARQIKSRNPSQRVILLTGFPPELCPPECDLMLLKPFSVVELRKAVGA